MLSRQSASRPRLAAHRRTRGQDRFPPEDGHARGAKAVPPTQPRDRVLPRLDQKQTGTAPVPPTRLGKSANGNALGLPHLQSATVDPPAQAASRTQRRLKPLRQNKNPTQTSATPDPPDHGKINASRFFVVAGKVFSRLRSLREVGISRSAKIGKYSSYRLSPNPKMPTRSFVTRAKPI